MQPSPPYVSIPMHSPMIEVSSYDPGGREGLVNKNIQPLVCPMIEALESVRPMHQ